MSNKYLEVTNLKKSFGGIKAVDVQSLNLNKNELTSIIGPNGACLLYTSPSPRDRG